MITNPKIIPEKSFSSPISKPFIADKMLKLISRIILLVS